jgi:hypothetical protein
MGFQEPVEIPELRDEDVIQFVADRLAIFRPAGAAPPNPLFPFDEEAILAVRDFIKKSGCEMIPRVVIGCLNEVLRKANPLIRAEEIKIVTDRFAREALKDVDCKILSSPLGT